MNSAGIKDTREVVGSTKDRVLQFQSAAQLPEVRTPIASRRGVVGWTPGELTARELQVVDLAACGYTNREIGLALGCSASTVKAHFRHINSKRETANRTEAVVAVLRLPRAA